MIPIDKKVSSAQDIMEGLIFVQKSHMFHVQKHSPILPVEAGISLLAGDIHFNPKYAKPTEIAQVYISYVNIVQEVGIILPKHLHISELCRVQAEIHLR